MAQGTAGLVSLGTCCTPQLLSPATMLAQPCLSSSLSCRSKNFSLFVLERSACLSSRRRGFSATPQALTNRDQTNHILFSSRKETRDRSSQRRSVITEVSEIRGSNEDVSESIAEERSSGPRAKFMAKRVETYELEEVEKPLAEYMALPASQYSVLDAERIERVDDTMFKCYAHRLKFFSFEVGPVLLVRVEEQPDGCCIRLLSCTLEGSPIVVAQNKKFSASMVNKVAWRESDKSPTARQLISDTTIEVTIEIPFAFRAIPVNAIEGTGNKVMSQLLKVMLPRFLTQLGKDYYAWASGDTSRKPVGTGEL